MTAAISKDDGATWGHIKNIEVIPGGAAAYASALVSEDEVLVTYYYQTSVKGSASWIRLKIIPLAWFYRE